MPSLENWDGRLKSLLATCPRNSPYTSKAPTSQPQTKNVHFTHFGSIRYNTSSQCNCLKANLHSAVPEAMWLHVPQFGNFLKSTKSATTPSAHTTACMGARIGHTWRCSCVILKSPVSSRCHAGCIGIYA